MSRKSKRNDWLDERVQVALAFICSIMLVTASVTLPVDRNTQFASYVMLNLLLCFILPLSLTKALGWRCHDVGISLGNVKRGVTWIAASTIVMLPALVICARMPQFQSYYPFYAPARHSLTAFVELAIGMTLYMLGWEFLFRGFMLFSLKRQIGLLAIVIQAIPFWLAHIGKPKVEFMSALPGGLIAGLMAWHCDSFLPLFVIHLVINLLFNALVIAFGS